MPEPADRSRRIWLGALVLGALAAGTVTIWGFALVAEMRANVLHILHDRALVRAGGRLVVWGEPGSVGGESHRTSGV